MGDAQFLGTTQADEGWILCDGQSDGQNGVTPNLIGKFIKGSLPKDSGTTGGASTIEIPDLTVNGTVGATALTAAQMPAHSHSGSTSPAGAHTHTRGSMNITGQISANWLSVIGNGPLVYVGDHPDAPMAVKMVEVFSILMRPELGREKHLLMALISMD